MKKHLLFTLFICLSLIAKSQEYIYLKSGKITTFSTAELNLSLENNYSFLVLKTLPSQIQKEEMKLLGVQFLEYLPQNTYIINLPKNFNLSLIEDFDIIALFNVAPENKLDPKIQNNVFPDWAFKDNNLSVKILFYKNTDISSIKNIFGSLEYSLNSTNDFGKSVSITINSDDLVNFSALNDVWFIEPIDPPSFKENKTARTLIRSNSINTNYSIGRHYNGEGINIMMQDDGLVGPHIDRQGRVDQSFCNGCSSSVGDDHGDHVSGTIMGAGNLDPITKGMADGSFLYVYGSSNNDAERKLPNLSQALKKSGDFAGKEFGKRISPVWIKVRRMFYIGKGDQLKTAGKLIRKNNFDDATVIWKQLIDADDKDIASKASYNMALASEIKGFLNTAIDWAKKSIELGNKRATHYITILNKRIIDQRKLNNQLNNNL